MGPECGTESEAGRAINMEKGKCSAVVLAAGQGKRMNSRVQKQFLELEGHPVVYYSLKCFQDSPLIGEIVLVTGEENIAYCREHIVNRYELSKVTRIVAGGKERYDSVYEGLLACDDPEYVYIHDGARPFVTQEMLERGLEGARRTGACVIGMPSKDTIKIADGQGCVEATPRRSQVWSVQTPQIFMYHEIKQAFDRARKGDMSDITDDAMIMERYGSKTVCLARGSYQNIKITTPEDLVVAAGFLQKK